MKEILEKKGFFTTKEVVDENVITTRMENEEKDVIVLERAFYPPDDIESKIYIINGDIDELELEVQEIDCEIIY